MDPAQITARVDWYRNSVVEQVESNQSCSRWKHFQENGRLFSRNNQTCRHRTIRATWDDQFWLVPHHLFPRSVRRIKENQLLKTNRSPSRQCKLTHIGSNTRIFEHSKHWNDGSGYSSDLVPNDFLLFSHIERLCVQNTF